jgi:hypothetical protein
MRQGLTPWRRCGGERILFPFSRSVVIWSEKNWRGPEQRLHSLEIAMRKSGAVVLPGGDYDRWDLETRGGILGCARAQLVIEEHGQGRQLVRLRVWPIALPSVLVLAPLFAVLAMMAAINLEWTVWAILNVPALALLARVIYECGSATEVIISAVPATLTDGEKIISGIKTHERTRNPA